MNPPYKISSDGITPDPRCWSPRRGDEVGFLTKELAVSRKMFARSQTWQLRWLILFVSSFFFNCGLVYLLLRG